MNQSLLPAPVPRISSRLARLFAPAGDREFILGDLHEHHARIVDEDGVRSANRWYRHQVIRSIPTFIAVRLQRRNHAPNRRLPLQHLRTDIRFGLRHLRRDPLFAIAALTTLSLGIGTTVALFSVVNAVLLEPPAFEDPGSVVRVYETRAGQPGTGSNMSYPDIVDVRLESALCAGGFRLRRAGSALCAGGFRLRRAGCSSTSSAPCSPLPATG